MNIESGLRSFAVGALGMDRIMDRHEDPDLLARELLPLLRRFCISPYGIAVGGSYAKGNSDALSDLDIYVFAQQVLPGRRRSELIVEALGKTSKAVSWGRDDPFIEGGTDFWYQGRRVECWLRNAQQVETTIASCKQGQIRREYAVWAVMGFFNYVLFADLQTMRIMEDPHGMLTHWKEETRAYPEPLRRAIVDRFLREAAFWRDIFHYRSAIERVDIIYTSGIV
jgi:hypothetical protein